MLNRWELLGGSLVITLILCLIDFYVVLPHFGFLLYNVISLTCGIAFVSIGSMLKERKVDAVFAEVVIITGVLMALWHVLNILIGVCI